MEASEKGEINSMASTNPAPVKISLKPGQPPYPVPVNVPVPYEITCEHATSGPFVPTPSNGGSSIRLSEIHEIEPTELEIEPNGTLTVEAEPRPRVATAALLLPSPWYSRQGLLGF